MGKLIQELQKKIISNRSKLKQKISAFLKTTVKIKFIFLS